MTAKEPTSTIVLVAIDASEQVHGVLEKAGALAAALFAPELHLLHVVDATAETARHDGGAGANALVDQARNFLDNQCVRVRETYTGVLHAHIGGGDVAHEILALAAEIHADYVVLGTHGRTGVARLVMGSVAESVVRRAPCSVLIARQTAESTEPVIEPPCADCVATRRASGGKTEWCQRHSIHHVRARLHYQVPQSFATGSMLVRPE